jgi:aconitate hydratase
MAFVGSPEVTAMAIAGDLGFNPLTDTLINEDGEEVMLLQHSDEFINGFGFDAEDKGFRASCRCVR